MTAAGSNFGLIGLAVMGQNLALNVESRGFDVAVYNRSAEVTAAFVAAHPGKRLHGAPTLAEFVATLKRPRTVMLMVRAGAAVDAVIEHLLPLLDTGDILVDGGNSLFTDTERRSAALASRGLRFVGAGVSGGEEGARKGPSIMPGGPASTWQVLRPIFESIAAKVERIGRSKALFHATEWPGPSVEALIAVFVVDAGTPSAGGTRPHRPIRGLAHGFALTIRPPCPGPETPGRSQFPGPWPLAVGALEWR